MKKIFLAIVALVVSASAVVAQNPKREFRGAWMHTVHQMQYHKQSTAENKAYLRSELDKLQAAGVNAIIWQVRPASDAFYASELEPWSRFLTDNGKAPVPFWDPLQFMIEEAHARGMELHAWLNPYRVLTGEGQTLVKNSFYDKHPDYAMKYGKLTWADPGLPENREFITKVVVDIVTRYDVDGIHFDDYFYPYPVDGKDFPDDKSYAKYGKGMDRGDWRRQNVDLLIEGLHKAIAAKKPRVIFGISPFGIWRNEGSDPRGSKTNGLQNYDALYADVLLWAEKGWIDYLLPQLYWEREHKRASYDVLVEWWNDNGMGRHMYIGQDVGRTMKLPDLAPSKEPDQLRTKINMTRELDDIEGNCWWPGYAVTKNVGGVADKLANEFQSTVALCPEYPWISTKKPASIKDLKLEGKKLTWSVPAAAGTADDAVKFVVYRFDNAGNVNLSNSSAIEVLSWENEYTVEKPGVYVVTALSRVNCESARSNIVVVE